MRCSASPPRHAASTSRLRLLVLETASRASKRRLWRWAGALARGSARGDREDATPTLLLMHHQPCRPSAPTATQPHRNPAGAHRSALSCWARTQVKGVLIGQPTATGPKLPGVATVPFVEIRARRLPELWPLPALRDGSSGKSRRTGSAGRSPTRRAAAIFGAVPGLRWSAGRRGASPRVALPSTMDRPILHVPRQRNGDGARRKVSSR